MYAKTSKRQEGPLCKISYTKCFQAKNLDRFHREGPLVGRFMILINFVLCIMQLTMAKKTAACQFYRDPLRA